jgi:hypothetical protein
LEETVHTEIRGNRTKRNLEGTVHTAAWREQEIKHFGRKRTHTNLEGTGNTANLREQDTHQPGENRTQSIFEATGHSNLE